MGGEKCTLWSKCESVLVRIQYANFEGIRQVNGKVNHLPVL